MKSRWFIALLAVSGPALADTGTTAQSIANSVFSGRAVDEFAGVSTDFEAHELSSLVGCQPEVWSGSTKSLVALIYNCENQDEPSSETTLELLFDQEQRLASAWLVADERASVPTEIALSTKELPSKAKLEKAFIEAVEDGADLSLGGIIPMPSAKRQQRLAALADCEPRSISSRDDQSRRIVYTCDEAPPNTSTLVTLEFDETNHPVRLKMQTGTTSIETIEKSVPVEL